MAERHIVPVAPANHGDPVVVVEVKQNGTHPLDVRLVGCEGEHPYVTTLKQRDIGHLKKKISNEEWNAILSHFLLQKQPEGDETSVLEGARMEYAPNGSNLLVTFRRDVQGIKMTLGEFELIREEEEEIDPISWAYSAAQAHNSAIADLVELKKRIEREQDIIDKLNAQLQDFIKTKEETETAMLQQFMVLLNEKKRKIRDQSRLLATAKVDKTTATKVQSAREETKSRKAGPSRTSKRKASAKAAVAEEEANTDQMDIDEVKEEEEAEERNEDSASEALTPDRSEDETEDEADTKDLNTTASVSQSLNPGSTLASSSNSAPEDPPPRRELPFARPNTRAKTAAKQPAPDPPPPPEDGDETEDDEEL